MAEPSFKHLDIFTEAGAASPVRAWPALELAEATARLDELAPDIPVLAFALDNGAAPIAQLLDDLVEAARRLFPAWLPKAEGIVDSSGLGREAVSRLARRAAREGQALGAIIEPIALAALSGERAVLPALADEAVARACVRLARASYQNDRLIVLLEIAGGADPASVTHAVRWLSALDICTVRVCGAGSASIRGVTVESDVASVPVALSGTGSKWAPQELDAVRFLTPVPGQPSPNSPTEQRMERYLARCAWASGRRWQMPWRADAVAPVIRPDLTFAGASLVVEFDGAEHAAFAKYRADRHRDRLLAAAGYTVIRFTNDEVELDLERVADEIRRFVQTAQDASA